MYVGYYVYLIYKEKDLRKELPDFDRLYPFVANRTSGLKYFNSLFHKIFSLHVIVWKNISYISFKEP